MVAHNHTTLVPLRRYTELRLLNVLAGYNFELKDMGQVGILSES